MSLMTSHRPSLQLSKPDVHTVIHLSQEQYIKTSIYICRFVTVNHRTSLPIVTTLVGVMGRNE